MLRSENRAVFSVSLAGNCIFVGKDITFGPSKAYVYDEEQSKMVENYNQGSAHVQRTGQTKGFHHYQ